MSDIAPAHQLDYELADEISADTPARLKALGDPLRHLLLDLVLERAMSVTELAERVRRPKGSVAHHVDLLTDVGLLQVVRTRKVRAMEERFYGRTARTIAFPSHAHDGDLPFFADALRVADMDAMAAAGVPSGFTMRSVRIPGEVASEFCTRVMALAFEFSRLPRGGTCEFGLLVGLFPTTRPVSSRPAPKRAPRKEPGSQSGRSWVGTPRPGCRVVSAAGPAWRSRSALRSSSKCRSACHRGGR